MKSHPKMSPSSALSMAKSQYALWKDFCYLCRCFISNPIKYQQRIRKMPQTVSSDPIDTHILKTERLVEEGACTWIFLLAGRTSLSPRSSKAPKPRWTNIHLISSLPCGVRGKQSVRYMGTKVQILTSLSAHKAIHSTFSCPGRMAKILLMDHSIVKIKQTKTLPIRLTYPIPSN